MVEIITWKKKYYKLVHKLKEKDCEIRELKQEKFSLPTMEFDKLHNRDKTIANFIKKNPGSNRSDVYRNLKNPSHEDKISGEEKEGCGTYNTIMKSIDRLIEYGIVRREKINEQHHALFYNEKNTILQVYDELESIKNLFFTIIERITKNESQFNPNNEWPHPLLPEILLIYVHTLGMYIIYSLLKWSKEIDDITTLNLMYSLVFHEILAIQKLISQSFEIRVSIPFKKATAGDLFSPLYHNLINRFFILNPEQITQIFLKFSKYENINEIQNLLKIVWKMSFPVYRYSNVNLFFNPPSNVDELEDLGLAIKYYLDKNKVNNSKLQKILNNFENK